ncbi:MAG: DUF3489 domain-containing protein [Pseudomonadota bacterium]
MSELKPPKTGSKLAKLALFLKGEGRTLKALSKSLGWQPHTVRAAMTRLRQRGYEIERVPGEGAKPSTFRLVEAS